MRRVAHGQSGDPTELTRVLRLFRDGVVVDQLDKPQLAAMARFLGVLTLGVTLGGDELVRTAVRRRLRGLAREDRELFAEGVEGLTKAELAGICESRGMRCEGLKKADYVAALDEWLRYSVELRIPAGMMVVSSMLALGGTRPLGEMFPSAVAMMNEEVVQEVEFGGSVGCRRSSRWRPWETRLPWRCAMSARSRRRRWCARRTSIVSSSPSIPMLEREGRDHADPPLQSQCGRCGSGKEEEEEGKADQEAGTHRTLVALFVPITFVSTR